MRFLLKLFVIFNFSSAIANEVLFESGTIIYKKSAYSHNGKHLYFSLFLKNVKSIDQHILPPRVVAVKVEDNDIPHLYKGSVKNLDKLRSLSFPRCKIKKIAPQAFQNLPKVKVLHLQGNAVQEIEKGIFNDLPIEELYLQRNMIRIIRPNAFDNMPNLRLVNVNSNELRQWDSNWFKNTPRLTHVYFRRNHISELPSRAFANIKTSHEENNTELVDTIIYLSKNEIQSIHPEAFEGIDALCELWLDRNNLTRIDRTTFSHLMELEKLSLQRNKISEIDRNAFQNVEIMSELNMSDNDLTCLPREVVAKARRLNIEKNDIECDCLINLRDYLQEAKVFHEIIYNSLCD